jgi:diguanylate cyclase (GGDEF)-like protein
MNQSGVLRRLGPLLVVAAAYFISGKLGLRLAFVNASATAVWPPAGIALAALVLYGYGLWPAILVSAFFVNFTTTGAVATSAGIAVGNTLEALAGAYLVNRFAQGRRAFDRARDIFTFTLLAGLASTTLSATIGVTAISFGGFAHWADFGIVWLTWWLGDATGTLVVAPAILLWGKNPRLKWDRTQMIEATALLLCVIVVTLAAFGGVFPSLKNYPLEFLCLPFFVWVAFRFGPRETATAILVLAVIAMWGTLHGFGPFVRGDRNESVLLLQAYMMVTSVTTLALAALVAERRQVEDRLRQLAVSDPLTGLANHRQLIYAVDAEIKRSHRTQRAFALVLLDLDGLKVINDRYGHLVGSLAVCRVAEALFGSCRGVDTAARFGGDEFALVLPETDAEAAWRVARRVAQRVAQDGEQPALSVSLGVAVYPQDGATADALLAAADRSLYESKAVAHRAAAATL